jgi:hypothetical protein
VAAQALSTGPLALTGGFEQELPPEPPPGRNRTFGYDDDDWWFNLGQPPTRKEPL